MVRSSAKYISHYALLWLLVFLLGLENASPKLEEVQTYIIQVDYTQRPEAFSTNQAWFEDILESINSDPVVVEKILVYSYSHVMHGFSARLTVSQLSQLERHPIHLATFQESFGKLLTTHSTRFLGLTQNSGIWPAASYGENVIIGLFDTGIWPESESFSDSGMSPIPGRWKGTCENGTDFSASLCNKKLIGARAFNKGFLAAGGRIRPKDFNSTRDFEGHGTHTSSTAAGNHVPGVSHFGYARGTAKGVAPRARIAMYKVGWATDTGADIAASDILAAMDQAIMDGVDIMSLSTGLGPAQYFDDPIAIASLSAVERGILVTCAAGNFVRPRTTINGAPWITTVGASTIDRSFVGTLKLGNGFSFEGTSYFPQSVLVSDALLYYGKGNVTKAMCQNLDTEEVSGKVVFCDNNDSDILLQVNEVQRAGASAGIFVAEMADLDPVQYSFPSLVLKIGSGTKVKDYATGATKATVKSMRFAITRLGTKHAPQVAEFSSRGPNPVSPGILKPDILAPGADIVAAYVPNWPFMEEGAYKLATDYALSSGTSMAAPHVAGAAALLRAVHRDWTPAAIRSALMTTAYVVDNSDTPIEDQGTGLPATPLDFGAGHIDPNKAMEPGLIYDINMQGYVDFLCGLGYTKKQLRSVLRRNTWRCTENRMDLNYPSFVAEFPKRLRSLTGKNFSRLVTYVGEDTAFYHAVSVVPPEMKITIQPSTLLFTRKYQRRSFVVHVVVEKDAPPVTYGFLKWTDQQNHTVSSPVVAISG
ncbi:hypothetical protein RJ640_020217 [Escallonia rubra]|uniref:Subtilisin-like protease n=1 Tax=Escallonia rubra TaxID=112253 RepID=A0AA88R2E2_9ASTE|nr:hypothetical protein RJ640_020217 [Escallonia rubra]